MDDRSWMSLVASALSVLLASKREQMSRLRSVRASEWSHLPSISTKLSSVMNSDRTLLMISVHTGVRVVGRGISPVSRADTAMGWSPELEAGVARPYEGEMASPSTDSLLSAELSLLVRFILSL